MNDDYLPKEKENMWKKNESAHQIMRTRNKNKRPFCVYCLHRLCAEPQLVCHKKALKKTKFRSEQKFNKFYMYYIL